MFIFPEQTRYIRQHSQKFVIKYSKPHYKNIVSLSSLFLLIVGFTEIENSQNKEGGNKVWMKN